MGRLATTFPDEVAAARERAVDERPGSAALELLYLAQSAYGELSDEAVLEVSELLGLQPTHLRGLTGFYSLLMEEPHGTYVIHVCTDLPCALRGADDLVAHICRETGAGVGQTSADGVFTVRTTTCLAACDRAPVMQVNLAYFHDLTPERVCSIIAELRQRAALEGPLEPPFGRRPEDDRPEDDRPADDTGA